MMRAKRQTAALMAMTAVAITVMASQAYGDKKTALTQGPVIRQKLLLHTSRFSIDASFGGTLGDPYVQNYFVIANLDYNINESFAIGADFAYGILHPTTSLTDNIIAAAAVGNQKPDIEDRLGTLNMIIGAHFQYIPIHGKFALFNSWVLHFDLNLLLGFAVVQKGGATDAVTPPGEPPPSETELSWGAGFIPAPVLGVGSRLFFTNWLALNLTFKDYIVYSYVTGLGDAEVENYFMLSAGLTFFLPPSAKYGP